jgi:hypothetical protein
VKFLLIVVMLALTATAASAATSPYEIGFT